MPTRPLSLRRRGRSGRVMRVPSGRERRMIAHCPHLPRGQPARVLAELNVNKLHGMAYPARIIRTRHMDSCMTWHTSACCTRTHAFFAVSTGLIVIDTVAPARLGDDNGCAKQGNHPDHQGARHSRHGHSPAHTLIDPWHALTDHGAESIRLPQQQHAAQHRQKQRQEQQQEQHSAATTAAAAAASR